MREKFIIWPEADADLAEAYHWYEGQQPGIGKAFLAAVESCFDDIQADRGRFRFVMGEHQLARLHRFPFRVYFYQDGDYVIVTGIFHIARDPGLILQRLKL
jgi:plasmid stabilization system protein ParE